MKILDLNGLNIFLNLIKENFALLSHTHKKSDITDFTDWAEDFFQHIYPIGSIYISTVDTNPSILFGFGTWVQIKDKFLLASGDVYEAGTVGGEAEHTLNIDEIPMHSHDFSNGVITNASKGTQVIANNKIFGSYNAVVINNTESIGGGQAHNNMPPYLTVYMWQRTE